MRFLILGPLEARGGDGVVALGGIKPRAVLAVLLLHANEPVSAERLALALWGEDAAGGAIKTVQVHVSRLRKALGDADTIETTAAGYCLRVRPDELDAAQFERLVENGRGALAAGQPERAAAMLREALALWRGPALAELAFEPFAHAEIARLEEQRLAALEARVEADLAAGRHVELVAELQRLVASHPTRERLAADLMLALYRCGRQADALEAYQDARRVLVAEIGVEPGPRLRELQDAILRQDVALELGGGVPDLPSELDIATAPPLVGREDELAWLRLRWERSRDGAGGLLVLAGERGAGKTRVAAELAGDAHRRGDAVLYASGSGPSDVALDVLHRLDDVTRPTLVVIDDVDIAGADVRAQLATSALSLARLPVLVLVCVQDTDMLGGLHFGGVLTLGALGEEAVRAIGRYYASAKTPEEIPADWLLQASGGLPRRVHELASQWARREAARRVGVVAGRAESERAQLRAIQDDLVGGVVELQEARERILPRHVEEPTVVCPFKGLASYGVSDADYFFGRERLVAELVARLVGTPLLAVVGPSGSGKSSVMHAGLLPELAAGVLPGSEGWEQVLIRPGAHPVRELAAGLANVDRARRIVLAVDQFEETFTACGDETERSEFVAELVHAAQDPGGRYVVVIALRADYYGRCAAYPELSALIAANNVLVRSMQRDELQRAVGGPCQRAGLRIEAELVQTLVADVEHEPGGLPLLSTALLELWQHRDGRRLRHATYERTGGVHGAVARLAEDAYGQLNEAQQAIARGVLMRLVSAGDGDGDAVERRRVALDELEINRNEDVARIVALLTDRRLLTVSVGTVEVAHEALLREWPRLRDWIQEDRAGLRIQRALSGAAKEWERLGRDDGALLRGSRLTEAVEWRDDRQPALNELEREFLAVSETTSERERVTRRRRTQLVMGSVAILILASVVVAVAALFAARARAIAASQDLAAQSAAITDTDPGLAFTLAREALKRHDTAQAENAMRQATLAYRVTAVRRVSKGLTYAPDPSPDGRFAVTPGADGKVILWRLGRGLSKKTLTTHEDEALGAAFDPDAKLVASVSYNGEVALTPISGGRSKTVLRLAGVDKEFGYSIDAARGMLVVGTYAGAVRLIPTGRDGTPSVLGRHMRRQRILVVSFNGDGTKVVSGGDDGQAYIWDLRNRTSIRLPHPRKNTVFGASFSPDGMTVATAAQDGRVRLWNANTGRPLRRPLKVDDKALYSVRFSADGLRVVTGGERGVARVSDVRNGQLLSEMAGDNAHHADFVPGSDTIIGTGDQGMLRTWEPLRVRTPRRSGTSPFFSPDGKKVVSGSDRGNVLLWDLAKGDRQLPRHDDHSITAFSPDGRHVLSASWDGSVRLYDITTKRSRTLQFPMFAKYAVAMNRAGQIAVGGYGGGGIVIQDIDGANRIKLPYSPAVGALAFSPDGMRLASASQDGTARVWNLQTRKVERVIDTKTVVNSLSYSAQGTQLATALADGTVRIWDIDGGRPVILAGHAGPVNTARFRHRGDRIVTAGDDGTVRVWDTAGGAPLVVLHRHEGAASGADFDPDADSVVSAGRDGMRITPCEVCDSLTRVMRIAAKRAPRALSESEHQRLMDRGD